MKQILNKILCFILIFCIAFTNVAYATTWADSNTKLPAWISYQNVNKLRLNMDLYTKRGMVVYGDYNSVPDNDFKNATNPTHADDNSKDIQNAGWYTNGNQKGEWRYHGYDYNGNLYTNTEFPVDSGMSQKPEKYNWVYRIWDKTSPYYNKYRLESISYINFMTIYGTNSLYSNAYKKQFERVKPFTVSRSTNNDKSIFNYAHAYSLPDKYTVGEVRMDHVTSSGKLWYASFSMPTISDPFQVADKTVVEATFDKKYGEKGIKFDITNLKEGEPLKVSAILHGKLKDDYLYDGKPSADGISDEYARDVCLDRQDIEYWNYYVQDDITGDKKVFKLNSNLPNTQYTFNLSIPYEKYKSKIDLNSKDVSINLT